ncbi:MAG: cytochrome c oxidase subunit II [Betaproteobacteria bacterium]|nr:cytochrome c oxidase subunit II [Betaproteobacteria bacterium]
MRKIGIRQRGRRFAARLLATAAACGALGYWGAGVAFNQSGDRIRLTAQKFAFSQPMIRVKNGRPVTFELTTPDFPHGFAVPDFNVRTDIIPGKTVTVTFTPTKAGKFHFLCDNFCGAGHDEMSGFLIVEE